MAPTPALTPALLCNEAVSTVALVPPVGVIAAAPIERSGALNGVAPATVVQGSTMFPRDRVVSSLTKYQVPFSEDESTDSLVNKLSRFYAERSLLREPILPKDQAEAYFLLLSSRLAKTTGQIIAVDGGLPEAFLR